MATATTVAGATPSRAPHRPPRTHYNHLGSAYLFVAPFIVVFAAMFIAPLIYALYLSLFRSQLVGGTVFVGIHIYTEAITDPQFLSGLWRIVRFFVIQVPIMLALSPHLARPATPSGRA